MGTDIHTCAQIKRSAKAEWELVACNIGTKEMDRDVFCLEPRDYNSFAIMADVRNGKGFAGEVTGNGWTPISEPRGLPDNFPCQFPDHVVKSHPNYDIDDDYEEDGDVLAFRFIGDHSRSYLHLDEILEWCKANELADYTRVGIITRDQLINWLGKGERPKEWCGGISGNHVKVASFVYDADLYYKGDDFTHAQIAWPCPVRTAAPYIFAVARHLREIKQQYDAIDVRIVFGFDS